MSCRALREARVRDGVKLFSALSRLFRRSIRSCCTICVQAQDPESSAVTQVANAGASATSAATTSSRSAKPRTATGATGGGASAAQRSRTSSSNRHAKKKEECQAPPASSPPPSSWTGSGPQGNTPFNPEENRQATGSPEVSSPPQPSGMTNNSGPSCPVPLLGSSPSPPPSVTQLNSVGLMSPHVVAQASGYPHALGMMGGAWAAAAAHGRRLSLRAASGSSGDGWRGWYRDADACAPGRNDAGTCHRNPVGDATADRTYARGSAAVLGRSRTAAWRRAGWGYDAATHAGVTPICRGFRSRLQVGMQRIAKLPREEPTVLVCECGTALLARLSAGARGYSKREAV